MWWVGAGGGGSNYHTLIMPNKRPGMVLFPQILLSYPCLLDNPKYLIRMIGKHCVSKITLEI